MEKTIKGQVTPEQIQAWKEQYGTVYEITVEDAVLYLKKFDRDSFSLALTYMGRETVKFAEALVENNYLGGCKEIVEDTEYLGGLIEELLKIVNKVKSSFVKH